MSKKVLVSSTPKTKKSNGSNQLINNDIDTILSDDSNEVTEISISETSLLSGLDSEHATPENDVVILPESIKHKRNSKKSYSRISDKTFSYKEPSSILEPANAKNTSDKSNKKSKSLSGKNATESGSKSKSSFGNFTKLISFVKERVFGLDSKRSNQSDEELDEDNVPIGHILADGKKDSVSETPRTSKISNSNLHDSMKKKLFENYDEANGDKFEEFSKTFKIRLEVMDFDKYDRNKKSDDDSDTSDSADSAPLSVLAKKVKGGTGKVSKNKNNAKVEKKGEPKESKPVNKGRSKPIYKVDSDSDDDAIAARKLKTLPHRLRNSVKRLNYGDENSYKKKLRKPDIIFEEIKYTTRNREDISEREKLPVKKRVHYNDEDVDTEDQNGDVIEIVNKNNKRKKNKKR